MDYDGAGAHGRAALPRGGNLWRTQSYSPWIEPRNGGMPDDCQHTCSMLPGPGASAPLQGRAGAATGIPERLDEIQAVVDGMRPGAYRKVSI